MVYKIKKNIYLESLVIAVAIFLIGIMFGVWLDNYRVSKIREELLRDTIFWDDSLFLSKYSKLYGEDFCNESLKLNLAYNAKIYERGESIERAIKENKFTPELREELKKYTLMQAQFWINSIELKEKCNFTYHNVVHLQQFYPRTLEERVDNNAQARIMLNLKEKCGSRIMLIPLVADLNLTTVDAILAHYNISKLPAVIVDEKYIFQGLTSIDEINKYTGC